MCYLITDNLVPPVREYLKDKSKSNQHFINVAIKYFLAHTEQETIVVPSLFCYEAV